jgi:rod shape determining protein RodA
VFSRLRDYDFTLLIPIALLIAVGLLTLYSLSPISGDLFLKKQFLWIAVGIAAMIWVSSIDYRLFSSRGVFTFLFYALCVGALGLLFVAGTRIKGVEGWFNFGGFLLQPVEFLKIAVIMLLAKYFSPRHIEIHRWTHILVSGSYIALPTLLLLLQPDLGSTSVIIAIWIAMMIFAGIPLKRLAIIGILFGLMAGIMWNFALQPYQKARIINFIDPWKDARGGGYQTIQSMIAVGAGRITGAGIGYGTQSHLHFLPEPETDFIFASFAEEWGFMGSIFLLLLFLSLFWILLSHIMKAPDNFSRFFIFGYLILLLIQVVVHIGANTGLLPITGLTLPFVSYGGSSLLSLFIGLGIIQSIKIHYTYST